MSQQIVQVGEWKPDYTKECEVCGAGHVVTGWTNGKKVFGTDMCGVCTWGEADMADPDKW